MLLLANSGGFGLLAQAADLLSRQRAGKAFLSLETGEHVLPPAVVAPSHTRVACLSKAGRLLLFPLSDLKRQANGGRGLTLMDVDTKDPLLSSATCGDALTVRGVNRGKDKEELLRGLSLGGHEGRRARKGHKVVGFKQVARVLAG
jgi:topoisomerase-4 subunit A